MNKNVIVPHDYLKLLIKFDPKNLQEYKGFFNVKFGVSMYQKTDREREKENCNCLQG